MRHMRIAILTAVALALVAGLSGCKKVAEVTSIWPQADKERAMNAPAPALIYPFRGTKAPDLKSLQRRPLSVKIENSPASRPQTGLNSADVVYETISEGGITRFNCIFHSVIPQRIGPVRSARLSDLWVVPQYDGLFFFSGANSAVNRAIADAKLANLSQDVGVSAPYSRSGSRPAPHNLYLNTKVAYETAKTRKLRVTSEAKPLQFERRSSETTVSVAEISVPFSPANQVRWEYQAAEGTYLRYNNGAAHTDEASGDQVETENVVVLWAEYSAAQQRTKDGSATFYITLGGTGRCSVFRDGRRFDGSWTADRNGPPRFKDASGKTIRLSRGRTWFQVIPLNGRITVK